MPIYYSLIARETTVLVDYTESTGDFVQKAQTMLGKMLLKDNTEYTYKLGK